MLWLKVMIKGETDSDHQILLVFTPVSINVQILFIVHCIKGTYVSFVTESLKLFVVLIYITSFDTASFGMTWLHCSWFDMHLLHLRSSQLISVQFISLHYTWHEI